ncbi:MAG: nicotinamide mononucleotide transporter [Limisphaerales bacterium]
MEWLWKYKGVDWAGMILAVLSLYYLGKQKKRGFLLGLVGNVCWMAFGIMTQSLANICSNLVYMAFNIHGWRQWRKHGWQKPPKNE